MRRIESECESFLILPDHLYTKPPKYLQNILKNFEIFFFILFKLRINNFYHILICDEHLDCTVWSHRDRLRHRIMHWWESSDGNWYSLPLLANVRFFNLCLKFLKTVSVYDNHSTENQSYIYSPEYYLLAILEISTNIIFLQIF